MRLLICKKKKTGKLFNFYLYAVECYSKKNVNEKKYLSSVGEDIGLLFQLADDFLDKKGSKNLVGKPVKKDIKKGKSTLLSSYGRKTSLFVCNKP